MYDLSDHLNLDQHWFFRKCFKSSYRNIPRKDAQKRKTDACFKLKEFINETVEEQVDFYNNGSNNVFINSFDLCIFSGMKYNFFKTLS